MVLTQVEREFLDGLLEKAKGLESPVLFLLHGLQEEYRSIRREHGEYIASALGRPLTEIYGAATFYEQFTLEETGKHVIKVCRGIVCHSRSSKEVSDAVSRHLGLDGEGTTEDGFFTLQENSCIGQCDGSPAMMIDGNVYRDLDPKTAISSIEEFRKECE